MNLQTRHRDSRVRSFLFPSDLNLTTNLAMSFLNNTVSRWFADTSMGAFEIQVKTRGSFSSAGDVSCAFKQRFRFCSSPFNISRLLFPCLKTIPNKFLISLALSDHFRANSSGFISAQVLHDLRRMAFRSFTPS